MNVSTMQLLRKLECTDLIRLIVKEKKITKSCHNFGNECQSCRCKRFN